MLKNINRYLMKRFNKIGYKIVKVLASKSVYRSSLSLQRIYDVKRCHCFAFRVLGVSHAVSDDVLQEVLEHCSCFVVDQRRDPLDAASTGESADGGLRDAHDGLSHGFLVVSLGSDFAVAFTSFTGAFTFAWHFWDCMERAA